MKENSEMKGSRPGEFVINMGHRELDEVNIPDDLYERWTEYLKKYGNGFSINILNIIRSLITVRRHGLDLPGLKESEVIFDLTGRWLSDGKKDAGSRIPHVCVVSSGGFWRVMKIEESIGAKRRSCLSHVSESGHYMNCIYFNEKGGDLVADLPEW